MTVISGPILDLFFSPNRPARPLGPNLLAQSPRTTSPRNRALYGKGIATLPLGSETNLGAIFRFPQQHFS